MLATFKLFFFCQCRQNTICLQAGSSPQSASLLPLLSASRSTLESHSAIRSMTNGSGTHWRMMKCWRAAHTVFVVCTQCQLHRSQRRLAFMVGGRRGMCGHPSWLSPELSVLPSRMPCCLSAFPCLIFPSIFLFSFSVSENWMEYRASCMLGKSCILSSLKCILKSFILCWPDKVVLTIPLPQPPE